VLNVVNTVLPGFIDQLVNEANKQREKSVKDCEKYQELPIDDEILELLLSVPHKTSK
jgi:hypothetical protein